jgi:hypothetical protein
MEDAGGHLAGRPRFVVANTPRLEPLGRSRVKSGDRREKWNAFRNVTFISNSVGWLPLGLLQTIFLLTANA